MAFGDNILIVRFHHCRDSFGNHNREWVSDRLPAGKLIILREIIKSHFLSENMGLEQNPAWDFIKLYFYNKEDNDFFKILSSDGFEV